MFFALAAFFGLSSIILGALVEHMFREIISSTDYHSLKSALHYQGIYTLFLLQLAFHLFQNAFKKIWAYRFLLLSAGFCSLGIFLFSFSIYLGVFLQIKSFFSFAPWGGFSFIFAWLALFLAYLLERK